MRTRSFLSLMTGPVSQICAAGVIVISLRRSSQEIPYILLTAELHSQPPATGSNPKPSKINPFHSPQYIFLEDPL
jgi:hypothetical protein